MNHSRTQISWLLALFLVQRVSIASSSAPSLSSLSRRSTQQVPPPPPPPPARGSTGVAGVEARKPLAPPPPPPPPPRHLPVEQKIVQQQSVDQSLVESADSPVKALKDSAKQQEAAKQSTVPSGGLPTEKAESPSETKRKEVADLRIPIPPKSLPVENDLEKATAVHNSSSSQFEDAAAENLPPVEINRIESTFVDLEAQVQRPKRRRPPPPSPPLPRKDTDTYNTKHEPTVEDLRHLVRGQDAISVPKAATITEPEERRRLVLPLDNEQKEQIQQPELHDDNDDISHDIVASLKVPLSLPEPERQVDIQRSASKSVALDDSEKKPVKSEPLKSDEDDEVGPPPKLQVDLSTEKQAEYRRGAVTRRGESTKQPSEGTKESLSEQDRQDPLLEQEIPAGRFGLPKPTALHVPVRTMPAPPLPPKTSTMQQTNGGTKPQQPHQYTNQYNLPIHAASPPSHRRSTVARKEGQINYQQGLPPNNWQPHPSKTPTTTVPTQNTRRPTPKSAGSSGGGAPVLRSFWSKVEKSLDGLANFEDAITGRAQQLVSTAVPKSLRQQQQLQPSKQEHPAPRRLAPRRSKPQPRSAGPTTESLLGPQLRWQNQQRLDQQKSTATEVGSTSKPTVSLFQFNASSSPVGETISGASSTGFSIVKKSRSDPLSVSARKLMPANGGASNPNDSNWKYPGQDRYSSALPPSNQTNPNQPSTNESPPNGNTGPPRGSDARRAQQGSAGSPSSNPVLQQQQQQQRRQASGVPSDQIRSPFGGSSTSRGASSVPTQQRGRDANWPEAMKRGPSALSSPSSSTNHSGPRPVAASPVSRPPRYTDEDDDERPSPLSRLLGSLPVPPIGRLFRLKRKHSGYAGFDAWDAQDEETKQSRGGFLGLFRRGRDNANAMPAVVTRKQATGSRDVVAKPVQKLMERSKNGKTPSLLTFEDKKVVRRLGQSRAVLDVISLAFFLVGIRQLSGLENIPFPGTFAELGSLTLPNLLSALVASMDTWAPLAFAAAILTVWTNSLLFRGRIQRKAAEVASAAESEASYARLFVRLVLSTPTERDLPQKFFQAAWLQVMALADLSRLRSFITYTISTILLMTVAFVRPLVLTIVGSFIHIITLEEWRKWPIPRDMIWANLKDTIGGVGHELKSLMEIELKGAGHQPLQFAFKASILAALFAVAYLPALEHRRATVSESDGDEENSSEAVQQMTERLSNLGSSSAGRLGILSKNGWVESLIERWSMLKDESSTGESDVPVGPLFRRVGYYCASWSLLAAPVLLFGFLLDTPITGWSSAQMPRWESLLEVCVLLFFTNKLLWNTIDKVVGSTSMRPDIAKLLKSVGEASGEMVRHRVSPQPFASSPNPTAGLLVRDLWAAHEVKRAWAIRAAHLACRNGEVLVVLGDDGAGKSRLLTTIAESILAPPKGALTARIQRGSVSLGGIDITKWDSNQLRKRVGLLLNDVNTLSNMAGLWSGLTLEEILEPGDGIKLTDPTHTSGAMEKSCMIRALKITGLYWSLLPRLPTKLSSVITANEEDLRPSPIRPRYHVLSPTEWSKLMLAKLLAQALYDNENSAGANDKVDNSLVGSLFLLDESTQLLSEIEEAKLLRDLRRTGVATVLSSNQWATGRLADRIVVMQDGCVIESGTHNELLSRGPHQSVYASKWHALTAF